MKKNWIDLQHYMRLRNKVKFLRADLRLAIPKIAKDVGLSVPVVISIINDKDNERINKMKD